MQKINTMKTKEEIRMQVQYCYDMIKAREEDLKNLRDECQHEEIVVADYMYSPGHILYGVDVCDICGKLMEFTDKT